MTYEQNTMISGNLYQVQIIERLDTGEENTIHNLVIDANGIIIKSADVTNNKSATVRICKGLLTLQCDGQKIELTEVNIAKLNNLLNDLASPI